MTKRTAIIILLALITGSVIAYCLIDNEPNTAWIKIYPKKRVVHGASQIYNPKLCDGLVTCNKSMLQQQTAPPITYKTVPAPYYYVRCRQYSPAEHNEPDRNAKGTLLHQGDVACNWVRFGTKVKIYFKNGQVYDGVVRDRVNKRAENEHFNTSDIPLIEFCWENKSSAECMMIDKRCGYYAKIVRVKE